MSAQTLRTDELPVGAGQGGTAHQEKAPRALRAFGLVAVFLGVAALAAATFVLSYSAIRAVALQAGITPHLARGYPLLLDAMLVIVLAAVLALRGAGLPSRLLAWLTLLVVVAAAAGADAMHAAGQRLPHQAAAITAAALPWGLVLIAFALLLAMLRYARVRRTGSTRAQAVAHWQPAEADLSGAAIPALELPPRQYPGALPQTTGQQATVPSHVTVRPVRTVPGAPSPAVGADDELGDEISAHPELAVDSDLAPDDPSTDVPSTDVPSTGDPSNGDWASDPADGTTPYPAESLPLAVYGESESAVADAAGTDPDAADGEDSAVADELSPEPTAGPDDPDMPMFHRLWSAPTPPADA
jgi:hypothetical protein